MDHSIKHWIIKTSNHQVNDWSRLHNHHQVIIMWIIKIIGNAIMKA